MISTRRLKGNTITWWGRRRWAIEGFFKTAKYQFWLANFGQQTLLGVYRWLILSLISFVLVHWVHLSTHSHQPPIWRTACELAPYRTFITERHFQTADRVNVFIQNPQLPNIRVEQDDRWLNLLWSGSFAIAGLVSALVALAIPKHVICRYN